MKCIRSLALPLFLILGATLALPACGGEGASGSMGRSQGVVVDVDREKAQITLDHEEIPDVMMAMKMTFAVADPALLQGVDSGDEVAFVVRHADGVYTVTEIEKR